MTLAYCYGVMLLLLLPPLPPRHNPPAGLDTAHTRTHPHIDTATLLQTYCTQAETPRNSDDYLMFSSRPLFCSNTLMVSSVMSSALHA